MQKNNHNNNKKNRNHNSDPTNRRPVSTASSHKTQTAAASQVPAATAAVDGGAGSSSSTVAGTATAIATATAKTGKAATEWICTTYEQLPPEWMAWLVATFDKLAALLQPLALNIEAIRKQVRTASGLPSTALYSACAKAYFGMVAAQVKDRAAPTALPDVGSDMKSVLDPSLDADEFQQHVALFKECERFPSFCFLSQRLSGGQSALSAAEVRCIAVAARLLIPGRTSESVAVPVAGGSNKGDDAARLRLRTSFHHLVTILRRHLTDIELEANYTFSRSAPRAVPLERTAGEQGSGQPTRANGAGAGAGAGSPNARASRRSAGHKSVAEVCTALLASSSNNDARVVRSIAALLLAFHEDVDNAAVERWWLAADRKSAAHYRALCNATVDKLDEMIKASSPL